MSDLYPHTTAGIIINENADPDVVLDMQNFLKSIISIGTKFDRSEGNSDAHIKSSIIGNYRIVPILIFLFYCHLILLLYN